MRFSWIIGIIFLQLKTWGCVWEKYGLGNYSFVLLSFCFVCTNTYFCRRKREWKDEVIYSIMIDRFNNGEPKNDKQLEVGNLEGYQARI